MAAGKATNITLNMLRPQSKHHTNDDAAPQTIKASCQRAHPWGTRRLVCVFLVLGGDQYPRTILGSSAVPMKIIAAASTKPKRVVDRLQRSHS